FKWKFKTFSGNTFIGSVSLSRYSQGNKNYTQAIIRDISANKELEQKYRLAQKMEAIGTLAGGIAHDFNNILAGLLGFNEMALRYAPEKSKLENFLLGSLKSIDRAKELVDQILTFSRHTEQEKRPVKIATVIAEALKLLRATIPSTIALRSELNSDSSVFADPTQLHQIIMNLCTNAFHALEGNVGSIAVNLRDITLTAETGVPETGIPPGNYVQLTVQDNGIGMDNETLHKVFEPYFTTKATGKGTGLGLAVVHGIITSHHGHISVTSAPDEGTTFTIILPITEADDASEVPVAQSRNLRGAGQHILFVDDEETIINLANEALTAYGYTVSVYTAPEDALEAFRKAPESFDLLITDMTMPNMTGHELTVQIRSIKPDIPVIMSSGYSEDISRSQLLDDGVNEFLLKPVRIETLLTTIQAIFTDHN
ncbi:hypothetical protein BVX99_02800, partial [bacterium F16]